MASLALRLRLVLLVAGFVSVSALRAWHCTLPPAETTDILRNLGYGRLFWQQGLRIYDLRPVDVHPRPVWRDLWPRHTYNYPVVTLCFFAMLAKLSTSLVVAKAVLSAIELGNSLLVRRLTGSPWLALAYYASPASLWWVSHEGQFEPLVVSLSLAALLHLRRGHPGAAYGWLALAVQAKLFPLLYLPYFLCRDRSRRGLLAFVLGLTPSATALAWSGYISRNFHPGYWPSGFNPFAWDFLDRPLFDWMPAGLVLAEAIASYLVLVLAIGLAIRAWRRDGARSAASFLPLVLFVAAIKSMGWGQFWYFLLVPAFALAIEERRARDLLFLAGLGEPRGAGALVAGPFGFYQWFPIGRYLRGGA